MGTGPNRGCLDNVTRPGKTQLAELTLAKRREAQAIRACKFTLAKTSAKDRHKYKTAGGQLGGPPAWGNGSGDDLQINLQYS